MQGDAKQSIAEQFRFNIEQFEDLEIWGLKIL